eukprot:scaffold230010_cov56-Cyclotella_meneghiniana.AAC.3
MRRSLRTNHISPPGQGCKLREIKLDRQTIPDKRRTIIDVIPDWVAFHWYVPMNNSALIIQNAAFPQGNK